MSGTTTADVVVVGLGAMGAATLYQLAKQGVDALGLDRYAPPHEWGSSHGETRITRCAVGEGRAYVPLVLASHRIWREIEAETGERLLDACGCLILSPVGNAATHHGASDFVGRTIASAEAYDIAHEVLGGAEIQRRFPQIFAPAEARGYYEPGGGFVYPERCIATQLALAERHGARVRRGAVRALRQIGSRVRIESDDGAIEAARVVVAAGSWAGPLLGSPFDRLLRVTRQVLHWFPVDGEAYAPGRHPTLIWIHGDRDADNFYGFPAVPGSNLLKLATEQYEVATTPETVDRTADPREAARFHTDHVAGRLASVDAAAARSAVCLYTSTPDSGFLIDSHPEMPSVTVVSACSGHGFKHSAGIGELVAQEITGSEVFSPAFSLPSRAS